MLKDPSSLCDKSRAFVLGFHLWKNARIATGFECHETTVTSVLAVFTGIFMSVEVAVLAARHFFCDSTCEDCGDATYLVAAPWCHG